MVINNETIILIPAFYLLALAAFIFFLEKIPRVWRLVIYALFCLITIFISLIYRVFDFISFNCASGARAENFFETLHKELASGTFTVEYLEVPGTTWGTFLSIAAFLAIFGGGAVLYFKIRYFSYITTFAAILLAFEVTAFITAFKAPEYIIRHNEMRKKSYTLIEKKLAEKIPHQHLAEVIKTNLKDFRYTYENLKDETATTNRILTAIGELAPATKGYQP